MPIPKPKPDQTKPEFIAECVPAIINEYPEAQAIAICVAAWDDYEDEGADYIEDQPMNNED